VWLPTGQRIRKSDYGKLLCDVKLKNGDIITLKKNKVNADTLPTCPLVDQSNKLVPRAHALINEWYDKYSNEKGVMTPESATRFILGAMIVTKTECCREKNLLSSIRTQP
jgi:hypothetical protein